MGQLSEVLPFKAQNKWLTRLMRIHAMIYRTFVVWKHCIIIENKWFIRCEKQDKDLDLKTRLGSKKKKWSNVMGNNVCTSQWSGRHHRQSSGRCPDADHLWTRRPVTDRSPSGDRAATARTPTNVELAARWPTDLPPVTERSPLGSLWPKSLDSDRAIRLVAGQRPPRHRAYFERRVKSEQAPLKF